MLHIRDILVPILASDTDPVNFLIDLQDANKKLIFSKLFSLLLFEVDSWNQFFFLLILLNDKRIRSPISD